MFIYLSKKIAIPNNITLHTVSWNNDQGWIACGGDEGLLKVLKLENAPPDAPPTAVAAENAGTVSGKGSAAVLGNVAAGTKGFSVPSNLSMNQTLDGHSGSVILSTWNIQQRKLTTSDQYGLIVVWVLYRGMWYEEMVNNRNRSVVADMQWNREGERICIVYEDGAVIVGSVDGNRMWGKEFKTQLAFLQWSPDSKHILFATKEGQLQVYDANGNFMNKINCFCTDTGSNLVVAGMDWYNGINGYIEANVPCLAVGFENGQIQIMRGDYDKVPVIVDTGMRSLKVKWNQNGSILAVGGSQLIKSPQGEEKVINLLQFYDPYGQHLRSLKVPGKRLNSLSWEYTGLRIALAVDSFIYFANVRPDYKWTYFADTLVYAYNRPERTETCCVFWNTKSGEKYVKYLRKLVLLHSAGDHCVHATRSDESEDMYTISICNAIGTPIEAHYVEFEPRFGVINRSHVLVASSEIVLWWQYKGQLIGRANVLDALRKKENKEYMFHIDDVAAIGSVNGNLSFAELKNKRPTSDPIACVSANDTCLVIARQSGTILLFSLPAVALEQRCTLPLRPQSITLNSNGRRLGIIDISGVLKILEFGSPDAPDMTHATAGKDLQVGCRTSGARLLDFERKDVWALTWADDNPELFAMMEKTRMYVFRNMDPEEPLSCTGYICNFNNLQITALQVDEIMKDQDNCSKDVVVQLETKSLRDTRNIISQVGLPDAVQFVEKHPHPRLWRLIAEAALEQLEYSVAQKAFIRCVDYHGIQFVKRVQKFDDKLKQKAEIAAYFSRFDEAEKLYMKMDRRDLAIDMRVRLGDWFRVVQIVKSGGGAGDDALVERSWNAIGDYYFERQRWTQALTYYAQARNSTRLAECHYILEDYEALERLVSSLPDNHPNLKSVAHKFLNVGLCEQAVAAFMKCGDVKAAVDSCVHLNQWNTAVELAEKHKLKEIGALFAKYAGYLLDKNKRLQAIELYRKANFCQKSAGLLYQLAHEAIRECQPPMRIKKLFVLAALEVERYHELNRHVGRAGDGGGGGAGPRNNNEDSAAALSGLLNEDANSGGDMKLLDNAWRGAEAYHYFMLAQRQFYQGNYEAALTTSCYLREYEDLLNVQAAYNLIALASFHAKAFEVCSRAFIKLEALNSSRFEQKDEYEEELGLPSAEKNLKDAYEALSLNIFTACPPVNPKVAHVSCTNCAALFPERENFCPNCQIVFPMCIASGQPILEYHHFMCHTCKHRAIESEIAGMTCCPLCHATL